MNQAESHRRARLEHARRRRKQGIAASVAVVVIVAVTLGVGAWRSRESKAAPSGAIAAHGTTTESVPEKLARVVGRRPPRRLSHDAPLRLWVGGDSLAGELGPALGHELASTGIVKTAVDFKVGSGLHDNGFRNWPERVPTQMATYSPDVAIFMIGANDASIVGGDASSWAPGYRSKVSEMMDLLGGTNHKRTVYWIGPPTMGTQSLDRGAKALGKLMADEAKHRAHVFYVDAYSMFSGPDGGYSSHLDLRPLHATHVLVRISDGVHFTNSGADWITYNVGKLLDEQWQITNQAGGAALIVTIESGGGSIPGYRPRHYSTTTAATQSTVAPTTGSITPTTVGSTTPSTVPPTTGSTSPSTSPPQTTVPHPPSS